MQWNSSAEHEIETFKYKYLRIVWVDVRCNFLHINTHTDLVIW